MMTPIFTKRAMLKNPGGLRGFAQLRMNSTQAGQKPVSPHVYTVGFYKTFTRPVAKVLLMATFTYQLAYWGWVKLEKDEIKREKTGEWRHLGTESLAD
ncbi:uncharacterized protein PAC_07781 [Phialocephala subalpina]|uniref:Uncharacterized protein n=1 Tax=Phialocephala subalpina TaxID=576137 RepID=A0A1L7WYN4_9HELO|nr:uncharacterized protein PAC_07781 [Phialocephala subalpina]